jgi:tetratricopeptide (TPR) repeat protein
MRALRVTCLHAAVLVGCAANLLVGSAQTSPVRQSPTQSAVSGVAEALRGQRFEEALTLSHAALKQTPQDYRLWTMRGMAHSGVGKLAPALAAYEHALKIAPNYLPALEGAAQVEYQQGSDRAKSYILRVLAQLPADPTSHAMLGVIAYKKKDCAEAVSQFQRAGATLAPQPELLTEYGSCLAILDRFEEAIPVLRQVLTIDPQRPGAPYNLALAQWDANHADDALATLQPLLDSGSDDQDLLTFAADICESKGDTPHAVELLRRAILAHPKAVDAYLQFSSLSYDHASFQVGVNMLNAGLTQLPGEARLYLARAVLYSEMGDFTKATDDFVTVNRLDPNLSIAGAAEGLARAEQHKSKEALASFRVAAKAHPEDAFTQYLLAEALSEEGSPQGSPEYLEAVEAATRAAKLDSKLMAALDLLSTLYLRDGDTQAAIEYCQKALAADPNDQQALFHLTLALRRAGRKDEVPAVLKRLVDSRNAAQSEGSQKKRYKLYEGSVIQPAPTTP